MPSQGEWPDISITYTANLAAQVFLAHLKMELDLGYPIPQNV